MSQDRRKPQSDKVDKKSNTSSPKKKFFSRDNISKVILPSLFLIGIILTPLVFEVFSTRHQRIDDVIDDNYDGNWPLPGIGSPSQPIDPDTNNTEDLMDLFTDGIPEETQDIILYRISPYDANEEYYWRLEVYDNYDTTSWDRDISTVPYTGYDNYLTDTFADGEFTVTSMEMTYFDNLLLRYFPAPYHYIYSEEFNNNYQFNPAIDVVSSSIEEDIYGSKLFNAEFIPSISNTTLTYDIAYTEQNNTDIKVSSTGFSDLSTLIGLDSELNDRYLQLPLDYSSTAPYTNAVANSLLDNSRTIYTQVMRNMIWLATNCTYDYPMLMGLSDDAPAPGEDYVEWFLTRRSGTAAHFASSLSILCRLQNIPTRLVVGFSYGEENNSDFVIRAKHLHSWVEVFLPFDNTHGYWVAFDPSPLLPEVSRDAFGKNVIGSELIFHCSNEFFLLPHMTPTAPSPYIFEPNPLSPAWFEDPYSPGDWYGPYVNREENFNIFALIANGKNSDLLTYLSSVFTDPGDLVFSPGEEVTFYDITDNIELGTAVTDSGGIAQITFNYSSTTNTGQHIIVAEWLGIRVST
ncbi:MAG: transglutaminase domain-containing protein, partial [Candidatus Heimdallarchaeota archaeon]